MNETHNILPEEWELIEAYLSQELTGPDLLRFEQQLDANPDWRKKVKESRLLLLGIQESVLQEKLNQFHQSINRVPIKTLDALKIGWKKWRVAAAILIIAGSTLLYLTTRNTLFDAYYTPDEGLPTYMGVTDHYEFEKAMVDYKTGQYEEAIAAWNKLLLKNPGNDTLNYFIGSALMADKEFKQAKIYFDKVIEFPASVFIQNARWYKALILLKEGNKKEALELLKLTEHPKKEALIHKLQE